VKFEKTNIAKLVVLLMAVVISQPLYSQSTNSGTGGRYVVISTPSGQFAETKLLDSQTGRVWMLRGQVSDNPFFVPCTFQLLDGRSSLVPIDEETELLCLQIARSSPTNSTETNQAPELKKLQRDLYYADAEAQFWQLQLNRIKAGKQWTGLQGWDKQGRAILDKTQEPSDESAKAVQKDLDSCLTVKVVTQDQIRTLTNKTP
jgi:hypothetical protein